MSYQKLLSNSILAEIRAEFPVLHQEVNGKPLVYLDNAATTHNPQAVIDCSSKYYSKYNSNIHRGTHKLARLATEAHEEARITVAKHIEAYHTEEVIFTSGATEGINLVAHSLALSNKINSTHNIVISTLEHHSNIVPWQQLCERTGAELRVISISEQGELNIKSASELIDDQTKIVAISHVSNALGTINPIKEIIELARDKGSYILVDAAQSAPHQSISVKDLNCDFLVFSGHKVYAPTGIGVLWGRKELLEMLPPWQGGGEMIKEVTFEKTTYNELPYKFEAGTPNIEGAISLAAALDWLNKIGLEKIAAHEAALLYYTTDKVKEISGLSIIGTAKNKAAVISFIIEGIHHYDLGTLLDQMGIATRTGHHCCQPLMSEFGISGTTRVSFGVYNTIEECDLFITSLKRAIDMLS